jgi:hypothetical protein
MLTTYNAVQNVSEKSKRWEKIHTHFVTKLTKVVYPRKVYFEKCTPFCIVVIVVFLFPKRYSYPFKKTGQTHLSVGGRGSHIF